MQITYKLFAFASFSLFLYYYNQLIEAYANDLILMSMAITLIGFLC